MLKKKGLNDDVNISSYILYIYSFTHTFNKFKSLSFVKVNMRFIKKNKIVRTKLSFVCFFLYLKKRTFINFIFTVYHIHFTLHESRGKGCVCIVFYIYLVYIFLKNNLYISILNIFSGNF